MSVGSRRRVRCVVEWIQIIAFKYTVLTEILVHDRCTKHGFIVYFVLFGASSTQQNFS